MNVSTAISLLDKIEDLVLGSSKVPLTNKVLVDEETLFELLDKLREYLPVEIEQARQIVTQKNSILNEAQRRAEQVIETAKRKSEQFVQENEIVRLAHEEAESQRRQTEDEIRDQKYGADKYSDEVLSELEEKVTRALTMVQNGRLKLGKTIESTRMQLNGVNGGKVN